MATSGLDFYLEREIALTVVERWVTFKEQRNLVQVEDSGLKARQLVKMRGRRAGGGKSWERALAGVRVCIEGISRPQPVPTACQGAEG